jgi:hypothetical protein
MYTGLHVKYPLFFSYFNETWIFSTDFREILLYQILWKSFQWEPSCPLRTDRRTDGRTERHDETNSYFFANLRMRLKKSGKWNIYRSQMKGWGSVHWVGSDRAGCPESLDTGQWRLHIISCEDRSKYSTWHYVFLLNTRRWVKSRNRSVLSVKDPSVITTCGTFYFTNDVLKKCFKLTDE